MTELPGVLAEIASVAGEAAALAIAQARGGTQVYIPPSPSPDHWLSALVGHEAALAIGDRLTCGVGGMRVELPRGTTSLQARQRARVDAMIAEGKSEREIAQATGYCVRGIRKRKARIGQRGDSRQLPLL